MIGKHSKSCGTWSVYESGLIPHHNKKLCGSSKKFLKGQKMDTKLTWVKRYATYLKIDLKLRERAMRDDACTEDEVQFATSAATAALDVLYEWIEDQERAISSVREEESTEEVLNA